MNSTNTRPEPEKAPDQYERCVLCGKVTRIPKDLHIDLRVGYVEGCGQLCRECYQELLEGGKTSSGSTCLRF